MIVSFVTTQQQSSKHCAFLLCFYSYNESFNFVHILIEPLYTFYPSTVEAGVEEVTGRQEDTRKEEDGQNLESEPAKKKRPGDGSTHQQATKSYSTQSKGGPAFAWSKTLSVDAPLEAN